MATEFYPPGYLFGQLRIIEKMPYSGTLRFRCACTACGHEAIFFLNSLKRMKDKPGCPTCRRFPAIPEFSCPHKIYAALVAGSLQLSINPIKNGQWEGFWPQLGPSVEAPARTPPPPPSTEPLRPDAWLITHEMWRKVFHDPEQWENSGSPDDLPPTLLEVFTAKDKPLTEYHFSTSPAPDGRLWLYITELKL